MVEELRFILVGYRNDKGYGVKDLDDEIVEYFSKRELLKMSKVVKIQGVEDGKINLEWFRDYYAKCVLSMDSITLACNFGLVVDKNGKFQIDRLYLGNWRFIEFVEVFDIHDDTILNRVCSYLLGHNSTLFHLERKFGSLAYLDISNDGIEQLDIQNVFKKGGSIYYTGNRFNAVELHNLKMHGINYKFVSCNVVYALDVPEDSLVELQFVPDSRFYVSKDCNLDRLFVDKTISYTPIVFLEDLSMRDKIYNIFYEDGINIVIHKCSFIYRDGNFSVQVEREYV